MPRADYLHVLALGISLVELGVLLTYYWPLVRSVPFALLASNFTAVNLRPYSDFYVSDLLFSNATYRALLTALVGLHLCVCCVFVVQLNGIRKKKEGPILVLEMGCLACAWLGWAILNAFYLDREGLMDVWHLIGAGMFIASSAVYFGLMIWNVALVSESGWSSLESTLFCVVVFLFVVSTGAGAVFVASVADSRVPLGWVFEHAAFAFFVAANLLLFVVDALFASHRGGVGIFSEVRITSL